MTVTFSLNTSSSVRLAKYDPSETFGLSREEALKRTLEISEELDQLDDLLFAAATHSLLIILQGRDTSGKDGAIRHLLSHINSQQNYVVPFKVPTAEEASHDFLWRVHSKTPSRGSITIFNRSHYEDVLAVRVYKLAPEAVWKRRYAQINHFEQLLADSNTLILKFFLHIDAEEQERRLLDREKDTEKAWKLNVGDWKEREQWKAMTEAYEDVFEKCSHPHAPWHIVPANHKWFRNLAVTSTIVETLRPHKANWLEQLERIGATAKAEIAAYRAAQKPPTS